MSRFRKVSRGRVKSEDGTEPLRLLYERSMEVRCVRLEKEGGIDPWKPQAERSKKPREVVLQLTSGSYWPLRSQFPERYRC